MSNQYKRTRTGVLKTAYFNSVGLPGVQVQDSNGDPIEDPANRTSINFTGDARELFWKPGIITIDNGDVKLEKTDTDGNTYLETIGNIAVDSQNLKDTFVEKSADAKQLILFPENVVPNNTFPVEIKNISNDATNSGQYLVNKTLRLTQTHTDSNENQTIDAHFDFELAPKPWDSNRTRGEGRIFFRTVLPDGSTDYGGVGMNFFNDSGSNNDEGKISFQSVGSNTNLTVTEVASGDLTVPNGSISASGAKPFVIDHPLEPDTTKLTHCAIEGPGLIVQYYGVVQLTDGKATVNIDSVSNMTAGTFEALTRKRGRFTSNESSFKAVKSTLVGADLTIECEDPASQDEVSWVVTAERKDKNIEKYYDADGNFKAETPKPTKTTDETITS